MTSSVTQRVSVVNRRDLLNRQLVTRRLAALRQTVARRHGWVALLVYAGLAAYWDRTAIAHFGSECPCGLPGDPAQYTWSFVWFPHALFSGLSLLHTHAMWSPTGINLAGATATPFLAFALAPITWLCGPIVAYNIATVIAPITAASAAYLLCRYVSRAPWAALLAGVSFGFGTYEIAQVSGHLHLAMIFCPPLAALIVLRFLDNVTSRRRFCVELTAILLVQFLVALEVFFTMTVIGAVSLGLAWLFGDRRMRRRVSAALPSIATAYLVTAVLMSWYLVALLHASAYAKGEGVLYPTDLLSLVTPMPYTWIGGHAFSSVSTRFIAGPGETNLYVGVPMLVILVSYLLTRWRSRVVHATVVLIAITLLWVLGQELYVDGKKTIWLPYSLLSSMPGFNQVLQGRVAVYFTLICAVVLSLWLARRGRFMIGRVLGALVAVACVLPNFMTAGTSNAATWTNPPFFSTGIYQHYLHRGETILPIRWGWLSESPMWQAETHMYFNLASGYFTTAMPPTWVSTLTDDLWNNTPSVHDAHELRGLLAVHHVSDVVVEADEVNAWAPVLTAGGLHATAVVGGVTLYHVPARWMAYRGSR